MGSYHAYPSYPVYHLLLDLFPPSSPCLESTDESEEWNHSVQFCRTYIRMVIYSHPSYQSICFVLLSSILLAVRVDSPSSRSPRYFPWNPRPAGKISILTHPYPVVCIAMIAEQPMPRLLGWDLRGGHYMRWWLLTLACLCDSCKIIGGLNASDGALHRRNSGAGPTQTGKASVGCKCRSASLQSSPSIVRPRAICIADSIGPPARKEYNTILPGLHETPYIYTVAFVWGRRSSVNY